MPTRRIDDLPESSGWALERSAKPICRHPDHNPPSHRVFQPGIYEHTCPACHRKVRFRVEPVLLHGDPDA